MAIFANHSNLLTGSTKGIYDPSKYMQLLCNAWEV